MSGSGRSATILVADDAADIRTLARITLASQGWTVHEAATPTEALDVAQRILPDAILLDIVFEGEDGDGFVVCRELRKDPATAAIPIVMLTARSTAADRAIAQRAGATAYLPKPFGPVDLIATLRSILGLPGPAPAIGILLVDDGRIRPDELQDALTQQELFKSHGITVTLGELLVREGNVRPSDIDRALERQRLSEGFPAGLSRRIRVVIADDHLTVRDGLRAMLAKEDGFEVVGVAADGTDALRLVRERRPDVAILDDGLRKRSGLEVAEDMRREGVATLPILYTFDSTLREKALAVGASYVNKDAHPGALAAEVRRAGGGTKRVRSRVNLDTARDASALALRTVVRQKRVAALLGVLTVAYAGAFLVAEPVLGPAAAFLAIVPVALAGVVLGPEAGVVAAILFALESLMLWSETGHRQGETVLAVGGNGLGLLALMGIGAGFGAMRILRGYLRRDEHDVDALIASGLLLGSASPGNLRLVTEAAREIVAADAVLTYAPVDGGALEIVATAGAPLSLEGQRESAEVGPVTRAFAEARPRILSERDARSFIPKMRSGIAVPACPVGERPKGVIIALSSRRGRRLDGADAAALMRFAPSVWLALKLGAEGRARQIPPAPAEERPEPVSRVPHERPEPTATGRRGLNRRFAPAVARIKARLGHAPLEPLATQVAARPHAPPRSHGIVARG